MCICCSQLDLADLQKELEKSRSVFPENPSVWVKDLAGYLNYKLQAPRSDPVLSQHPHGPCATVTRGWLGLCSLGNKTGRICLVLGCPHSCLLLATSTVKLPKQIGGSPSHPFSTGIRELCLLLWSWGVCSQLSALNARGMVRQDFPFLRHQSVPTRIEDVSFRVARGKGAAPCPSHSISIPWEAIP